MDELALTDELVMRLPDELDDDELALRLPDELDDEADRTD